MVSKKRKIDRSEKNIEKCGTSRMRKNTESQGCLPDDLLIIILLYLPADLLYNVMRFICRHWFNIIQSPSFISSHLKNSTTGLFLAHFTPRWKSSCKKRYILKPTCDGVEVKELNFKCASKIHASCNGLVFVLGPNQARGSQCPCYIANLVTKQQLPLPLIPDSINSRQKWHFAYTPTSKVYKVIYSGERKLILTVGVDKGWRKVDISQLPLADRIHSSNFCSISIKGFLYWVQWKVPYIICFDIETETFSQIPLPPQFHHTWHGRVLTMGSSLCLYKHLNDYSFVFWLLKDPETGHGQWGKTQLFSLKGHIDVMSKLLKTSRIEWLSLCGWLRNGELLVIGTPHGVVVWNVDTNEFHNPEELNVEPFYSYPHVESLVALNNSSLVTTRSKSKIYSKDYMRAEFDEPSSC